MVVTAINFIAPPAGAKEERERSRSIQKEGVEKGRTSSKVVELSLVHNMTQKAATRRDATSRDDRRICEHRTTKIRIASCASATYRKLSQ